MDTGPMLWLLVIISTKKNPKKWVRSHIKKSINCIHKIKLLPPTAAESRALVVLGCIASSFNTDLSLCRSSDGNGDSYIYWRFH